MNIKVSLIFLVLVINAISVSVYAQVSVNNIRAAQRAGAKIVDIDYDLIGDASSLRVNLYISSNNGITFDVPANSLTGAVGNGVSPGVNRRITWDAGADWPGQYSNNVIFRITADNGTLEVPAGFSIIPGGSFEMGDPLDGMPDAQVHLVNVSTFLMSKYEVTKAEWNQVKTWAELNGYTGLPEGDEASSNRPITGIPWIEAVKWCNARTEWENATNGKSFIPCYTIGGAVFRTGNSVPDVSWHATGYRLPTEAEWEKAARGGGRWKRFPWGNEFTGVEANSEWILSQTQQVGGYSPNDYGLYDMIGNAAEWCWDWYSPQYNFSPQGNSDPTGPESEYISEGLGGHGRITRGGSFGDAFAAATRGYLWFWGPGNDTPARGFRLARR